MKQELNVQVDEALQAKFDSGDTEGLRVGGVFAIEHYRDGKLLASEVIPNIVTNQGLDYILETAMSGGSQNLTHYIGIFANNYTPQATDVMATFAGVGVADEITTEVAETTRPTWVEPGIGAQTITNSASPAVFTANTTVSAYGAFLSSSNVMDGTAGVLVAASKFAAVRNLLNTDTLNVTYTLNIADA